MPSGKPVHVNTCTLKGNMGPMLTPNPRQVVIQITCYAHENDVNIENNDACREQQCKAQSFVGLIHCLGNLLFMFSNWGSGVTRGVVGMQITRHRYRIVQRRN